MLMLHHAKGGMRSIMKESYHNYVFCQGISVVCRSEVSSPLQKYYSFMECSAIGVINASISTDGALHNQNLKQNLY